MSHYILGVDIGGTKSHASLFTVEGQLVGIGVGGQGNADEVGIGGFTSVLHEIIRQAINSSNISNDEIVGAGFGIAGYDWPSQKAKFAHTIQELNLRCPCLLVNDAVLGLLAGTSQGWGIAVVSGTGCNARGRDQSGNEGRVLGYGMQWGEGAGASEIVQRALQHIGWQWTKCGPETRITSLFLEKMKARNVADLLEGIILEEYQVDPGMAPEIFRLAEEGDAVAREIVLWAGQSLGNLVLGVARQLHLADQPFEVVMLGSLFKADKALIQPMQETVLSQAPQAIFKRLHVPPVAGAVLLGFEAAGISSNEIRDRVLSAMKDSPLTHTHSAV